MTERDVALNIVKILPDEKIKAFLELFVDENLKAKIETNMIANDTTRKHYNNFDEIIKELDNE